MTWDLANMCMVSFVKKSYLSNWVFSVEVFLVNAKSSHCEHVFARNYDFDGLQGVEGNTNICGIENDAVFLKRTLERYNFELHVYYVLRRLSATTYQACKLSELQDRLPQSQKAFDSYCFTQAILT